MSEKETRQCDYVAPPTISGPNAVHAFSSGVVAAAEDLHAGLAENVLPAGHYVSVVNMDTAAYLFVVFDSVSTGTAATTANAVPLPPLSQRDFLLSAKTGDTYPNRYMKHIATGAMDALWWVSTYHRTTDQ